jgi:hypothetical protein
MKARIWFLLIAVLLVLLNGSYLAFPDDDDIESRSLSEIRAEISKLSNADLRGRLEKSSGGPEYEVCLDETIRRGGDEWAALLKKRIDSLSAKYSNDEDEGILTGKLHGLELLTALRRTQNKPDPLKITIQATEPLVATPHTLPQLKVAIKNVDIEKQSVGFREGGDYHGGRQDRWRIQLTDEKGNVLPEREPLKEKGGCGLSIYYRGGQHMANLLKYGESWGTVLDVSMFINHPKPGKYKLQVLYHNSETIALENDISGLIVCRSDPITLVIEQTVVKLTKSQREYARRWISDMKAEEPVKVVVGSYGEWAYEFVDPKSPEGKLLSMGIQAAPILIEALQDESFTQKKRVWILSLLFSITGEKDPQCRHIIGKYEYLTSGWQVFGGRTEKLKEVDKGFPSKGSESESVYEFRQNDLIKEWQDWLATIIVVDVKDQ